jgi:phage terminase large subunit
LHNNPDQVLKSLEKIDICWVEEAHGVTEESWKYLIPTIRTEGRFSWLPQSEIWISFNQHDDSDPTFSRFVTNARPDSVVVPVTWRDNPWFPSVLEAERQYMLRTDPEAYDWVWELQTRRLGSAIVFKGKYVVEAFDDPTDPPPDRLFFGFDFGFAADPSAATRSYITERPDGKHLWISHEAYGHGVELDDLHKLALGGVDRNGTRWPGLPNAGDGWPVKGDSSRPETISHLRGSGLNITAATKWPGSVEDGIAFLKSFVQIHIHERCTYTKQEARLYSYKVDKKSGDVLPQVLDKHNHIWDSERYGLDDYITASGGLGTWQKLAQMAA